MDVPVYSNFGLISDQFATSTGHKWISFGASDPAEFLVTYIPVCPRCQRRFSHVLGYYYPKSQAPNPKNMKACELDEDIAMMLVSRAIDHEVWACADECCKRTERHVTH